ncbi:MAG TPA: stage V sporulation protein T [Candidatus Aphodomonas merdavium]|uniref:Stage V sporulation protein T n=1 Tax=Candidatus Avichristensenella intestinipullorum TaxID=2840693 RepID=A0A9D0YWK0_9FIRM|nr:stage V sporulation protein T [Candidatus Avichristensenella intestinipullorum]HIT69413.1 stage V sporulation protein T [Candidatus Aphodomonas merdavium]
MILLLSHELHATNIIRAERAKSNRANRGIKTSRRLHTRRVKPRRIQRHKEAFALRATGIVRRIDELGRVVIPKEIRRTLRIREGDPLEIYTDRDGEVILKKYSPIGEIAAFAKDYTESLFRSLGHIACICDRDMVVAASGVPRKELWDKPISRDLEAAIAGRQSMAINRSSGGKVFAVTNEEDGVPYTAQVFSPIIADGEAIGGVLLLSREQGVKMGDTELKVAETTAGIVGRQMEQ